MSTKAQQEKKYFIDVKHLNNNCTVGFVYGESKQDIMHLLSYPYHFIAIEKLSKDILYVALSDIKSFKLHKSIPNMSDDILSQDPYKVLNVQEGVSKEQLQKNYTDLLKIIHPDIMDVHALHPIFKVMANDLTRHVIASFEFIWSEITMKEE